MSMSEEIPPEDPDPEAASTVSLRRPRYLALLGVLYLLIGYNLFHAYTAHYLPEAVLAANQEDSRTKVVIPERIELHSGPELMKMLQGGGYVLYMRHFQTDHSKWHEDPIKYQHGELPFEKFFECKYQRPLTDWGRERAKAVGDLVRRFQVPIAKVTVSPYCRVREGAELMMGREPDEITRDLVYRGGNLTHEEMGKKLLPFLGRKPPKGSNDLVMAHRTNMDDVGRMSEGEMWVIEPQGGEAFAVVGKIKDSEWFESLVDERFLGAAEHRGGLHR